MFKKVSTVRNKVKDALSRRKERANKRADRKGRRLLKKYARKGKRWARKNKNKKPGIVDTPQRRDEKGNPWMPRIVRDEKPKSKVMAGTKKKS